MTGVLQTWRTTHPEKSRLEGPRTNVSKENKNRTYKITNMGLTMYKIVLKSFYRTVQGCEKMEPEMQRKPSK